MKKVKEPARELPVLLWLGSFMKPAGSLRLFA
jgi:hypothetical protein